MGWRHFNLSILCCSPQNSRKSDAQWNAASPHGTLDVLRHDILTDYHTITAAEIESVRLARTNNRAIQNARTMYHCIKASIKGSVRDTIFFQASVIPAHPDGVALFKKLTDFTTVASVQLSLSLSLSLLSINAITSFNPFDHAFDIPAINTKLTHLFVLATTKTCTLDDLERIQHTLNVYGKILQPKP